MKYAPILIPTLCRSAHFIRLVESLKKNPWARHTTIYLAIDFPPNDKYKKGWEEINHYLQETDLSSFDSVKILRREKNYGAIRNGDELIQSVFQQYDRLILLPDDIDVSPNFIEYMDRCLNDYESDDDIVAVCGYSYPVEWEVSTGATIIKQQTNCAVWGIGYWKEKYSRMLSDLSSGKVLNRLPQYIKEKGYQRMIDAGMRDYIEAACYKWCYGHQWLLNTSDIGLRAYLGVMNKYAITPVVSKVRNYGFDGSGEYCQSVDNKTGVVNARNYDYLRQPIDEEDSFTPFEDSLCHWDVNRQMLNVFDSRPDNEMQKARRLLWLCESVGIWAAKLYCYITMPYDIVCRIYKKYLG